MAHTWVSTVKVPDENTAREIVPYKIAVSNNSDVTASLPSTLNANAEFIINKIDQTGIKGFKGFDNGIGLYDSEREDYYTLAVFDDYFGVYNSSSNNIFKVNIHERSIEWKAGIDSTTYTYDFPTRSGTIGLAIDILDLRSSS